MTFIHSESGPHLLLHDERTDLGGSKEEIMGSEGGSVAGLLYECDSVVFQAMKIVEGSNSEDTSMLSTLREVITDDDLMIIKKHIEIHMRWKILGLLRAAKENRKLSAEMKEKVDIHYIANLAEDITSKVVSRRLANDSMESASL